MLAWKDGGISGDGSGGCISAGSIRPTWADVSLIGQRRSGFQRLQACVAFVALLLFFEGLTASCTPRNVKSQALYAFSEACYLQSPVFSYKP